MKQIDLRSDTVTRPSIAMKEAMMAAKVGDDVYEEDPTINELEALAVKMLGTQDSIFCTSGTQTNLLALMTHCERGENNLNFHLDGARVFNASVKLQVDVKEITKYFDTGSHLRLVTHLDISKQDIDYTIQAFKDFFL